MLGKLTRGLISLQLLDSAKVLVAQPEPEVPVDAAHGASLVGNQLPVRDIEDRRLHKRVVPALIKPALERDQPLALDATSQLDWIGILAEQGMLERSD